MVGARVGTPTVTATWWVAVRGRTGGFHVWQTRRGRRAVPDACTSGVVAVAPDAAAPRARVGGRRVADRGGDPGAVSAQGGRPRERQGRGLPVRRLAGFDRVGCWAGGDDVGGQCP